MKNITFRNNHAALCSLCSCHSSFNHPTEVYFLLLISSKHPVFPHLFFFFVLFHEVAKVPRCHFCGTQLCPARLEWGSSQKSSRCHDQSQLRENSTRRGAPVRRAHLCAHSSATSVCLTGSCSLQIKVCEGPSTGHRGRWSRIGQPWVTVCV